MFRVAPYHAVPKLHEAIKQDCPLAMGWRECWVTLLPVMIRQIRDPKPISIRNF